MARGEALGDRFAHRIVRDFLILVRPDRAGARRASGATPAMPAHLQAGVMRRQGFAPGLAPSTSALTMRPRGPEPDSDGKVDALLGGDAAGERGATRRALDAAFASSLAAVLGASAFAARLLAPSDETASLIDCIGGGNVGFGGGAAGASAFRPRPAAWRSER